MTDQRNYEESGEGRVEKAYVRDEKSGPGLSLLDRISRFQEWRDWNFQMGRVVLGGGFALVSLGGLVACLLGSGIVEKERISRAPTMPLDEFKEQLRTNGLSVTLHEKGVAVHPKYVALTGFATFAGKNEKYDTNYHRNMIWRTYTFEAESTNSAAAAKTNSMSLYLRTRTDPLAPETDDPVLREAGPEKVSVVVFLDPRECRLSKTAAMLYPKTLDAAK